MANTVFKIEQVMDGVMHGIKHPEPGLMTGLSNLDRLTYGIHQKQLTVIGGRPSMGKSAFALDIALNLLLNDTPIMHFTMEDSTDMVVRRLLVKQAHVNMIHIRDNQMNEEEWSAMRGAADVLRGRPLVIDDGAGLTPDIMRRKVEQVKDKIDLKAVFIDYLQLFHFRNRNRQESLEEVAATLKDVSKEFDVATVVMSQLNREPDKREDHMPRMSDLRGSGGIEQSADLVLLLYRPSYYTMQEVDIDADDDGEAWIVVGKQKNGPTGKIAAGYVPDWMSFMNMPQGHEPNKEGTVF